MSESIEEAAMRWHLAQSDAAMDWDAFTAWLEESPLHQQTYDAIARLDDRIERARPFLRAPEAPAMHIVPQRPVRRLLGWSAAAAAIVGVGLLGWHTFPSTTAPQVALFSAPAGKIRAVPLPYGSRATLAPGSTLRVISGRDTSVALEGKAFFVVRHDPRHAFRVRAGKYEIRDIGTRFEATSDAGILRVLVTEGRVGVRVDGLADEVSVPSGRTLTAFDSGRISELAPAPRAVAAWRDGRFVYTDTPLSLVAADISRYTGRLVLIDDVAARRRFSGILARGTRETMVRNLQQLTGLNAGTEGNAIRLGDGAGG